MMQKKKKTNVRPSRKREDRMMRVMREDAMHMYELLAKLDGEQDIIDELAEGIGNLEDLCEALIDQAELPKKLRNPKYNKVMN